MKRIVQAFCAAVLLLLALAGQAAPPAPARDAAPAYEAVAFNQKSRKYHCPSCPAARRCTVNCVKLAREQALRQGGVACKICGGRCY